MKIGQMKTSKYLKKEDVGNGKLVTIAKIDQQDVSMENDPADMKYVMYFKEDIIPNENKGMVINWTNIQLCAKACGTEETDEWPGHQIVLYDDLNVSYGGKLTGGIRIRAKKPENQMGKQAGTPISSENPGAGLSDADAGFDDGIPF